MSREKAKLVEASVRHAMYYLTVLSRSRRMYDTGGWELIDGIRLSSEECPNIIRAHSWTIEAAETDHRAAALCVQMTKHSWQLYLMLGRLQDGLQLLTNAVRVVRHVASEGDLSEILHGVALLTATTGDIACAAQVCEQALNSAIASNAENAIDLHSYLGALNRQLGRYEAAQAAYLNAWRAAKRHGKAEKLGQVYNELGNARLTQGRYESALFFYKKSLAAIIRNHEGPSRWKAISLNNHGLATYLLGGYTDARDYYLDSMRMSFQLGDERERSRSLHEAANVCRATSDVKGALQLYSEALAIKKHHQDRRGIAFMVEDLAGLAVIADMYEWAAELYGCSEATLRELGARPMPYSTGIRQAYIDIILSRLQRRVFDFAYARGAKSQLSEMTAKLSDWLASEVRALQTHSY